MEASWSGSSLKLEDQTLVLEMRGAKPVSVPLGDLVEFSVVPTRAVRRGRKAASTPDAAFVVGWREDAKTRWAAVPVPREALHFQLFLTRLNQLRPDADHRDHPSPTALRQIRGEMQQRLRLLVTVAVVFALIVLLVLFLFAVSEQ
ncbi:MAG: hypothetical protein WBV82_16570 [Myxococcaceae bacterium]